MLAGGAGAGEGVWIGGVWACVAPANSRTAAGTMNFMRTNIPLQSANGKTVQAAGSSTQKVAPSPGAEITPMEPTIDAGSAQISSAAEASQ